MREDWIEVKLGEILDIERGGSPRPIKDYLTSDKNGINWIKIGDAPKNGKYIKSTQEKIKPSGLKKSRLVVEGNFLLSNSMSFGRPYIMQTQGAIHDGWLVLRGKEGFYFNKDYLYYMLSSPLVYSQFERLAAGSTVKNLNIALASAAKIFLAPLPEQRAIVARIEQLFSELDNGIASFKTAQAQLEIYRQSVLKKAFEGELTKEWRDQQQLSLTGWRETTLDKLTLSISDGDHQAPPKTTNGIPFITISNIKNNTINFANTFYVDDNYYDKLAAHRKPLLGDILYTVTGSFGIPVLIEFEKKFCFQRHIGLIRALESINRKWLFWLLSSDLVFKQAQTTATGTAQKTVALSSLRKFIVPVCSIEEQEQIVQEIESRLSVCDKLAETIKAELDKAEALRQSILKKAFEGRLLTDVELAACRQEPDWESADKLLTRIKTEPQTTPKTKKTQQGKS